MTWIENNSLDFGIEADFFQYVSQELQAEGTNGIKGNSEMFHFRSNALSNIITLDNFVLIMFSNVEMNIWQLIGMMECYSPLLARA